VIALPLRSNKYGSIVAENPIEAGRGDRGGRCLHRIIANFPSKV
jgi:hypothetical protein